MKKKLAVMAAALLWAGGITYAQTNLEQYASLSPKELIAKKELSDADLESMVRYYRLKLKDEAKAKELETLLIQKDPKGPVARFVAFQRSSRVDNPADRMSALEAFLNNFPKKEWNNNPKGQGYIYYTVYRTIGTDYFEARQFDKLLNLTKQLNFKEENEIFRWNAMRAYVFRLLGYDTLYKVTTPMIKDLVAKVNDSSYLYAGDFNAEGAMQNARQQLDNQLNIYIQLLNSLEKYDEAYAQLQHLSSKGRYGNAELNDLQLVLLGKLKKDNEILPFLEKAVNYNAVTEAMYSKLKASYLQTHKSMDGYEAYLASLQSADEQSLLKEYVKSHLLNKEYQPFAVESAEGDIVRSSEWGDKIVVVDFWATWCKPCIQALPGMQMLREKYKNDDGVAVYCMGTMQSGDYKTKSVNYVKSQGLKLNLLHDGVDEKTGDQSVVFRTFVPFFHSSAIPRKVVLKDGMMRYSSEGYSGSPSKLVDELSYVIELLKAEK